MVIGSAQSGMQIVDDLLDAGREVLLSTGKAGRDPRRYRGRDLNYWYDKLGLMDRRAGDLDDPRRRWSGWSQHSRRSAMQRGESRRPTGSGSLRAFQRGAGDPVSPRDARGAQSALGPKARSPYNVDRPEEG